MKNSLALLFVLAIGLCAQTVLNQVGNYQTVRIVSPGPTLMNNVSNAWIAIDLQKTNTALNAYRVERLNSNTWRIRVEETVNAKLVEN